MAVRKLFGLVFLMCMTASISCAETKGIPSSLFFVQAGAYLRSEQADLAGEELGKAGIKAKKSKNRHGLFSVYLGEYKNRKDANSEGKKLMAEGKIKNFSIVTAEYLLQQSKTHETPVSQTETTQSKVLETSERASFVNQEQIRQAIKMPIVSIIAHPASNELDKLRLGQEIRLKELDKKVAELLLSIKTLQTENTDLQKNIKEIRAEKMAMTEEILQLKTALASNGNERLLSLADAGEVVFLQGVGEVLMGAGFGKNVFKVPSQKSDKADPLFNKIMADRITTHNSVYYIADSKMLNKH